MNKYIRTQRYAVEQAGMGSSVYFLCRTIGAIVASMLLGRHKQPAQ